MRLPVKFNDSPLHESRRGCSKSTRLLTAGAAVELYTPKIKRFAGLHKGCGEPYLCAIQPFPPVPKKTTEITGPAPDITILLKIDRYFIAEQLISSVSRFGKGCRIALTNGDEIVVNTTYSRVRELLGK